MKGKHGVSMQSIEYAPKKKGNVLCRNCKHLIFKTTGNSRTKDTNCNHYCTVKNRPTWYTAQCYCKHYEAKENADKTNAKIKVIMQKRAEQVKRERRKKKRSKQ